MSRSLGPRLPPELVSRLSQADLAPLLGRAIPLISVDADGRPHPMLCSYLELRAIDAGTIRVAIGAASRSAANLEARGAATLLLIEPGRTLYVKCRGAAAGPVHGALRRFDLAVEDVLEDSPAAWEEGLRITGGITYGQAPALDAPWAQAVLAVLRDEPAAS